MAFITFGEDKDNKIPVYMSRKITFLTLFLWLMTVTFPVIAQQKADTTYTFRESRHDLHLPVRSAEGYVLCSLEWE